MGADSVGASRNLNGDICHDFLYRKCLGEERSFAEQTELSLETLQAHQRAQITPNMLAQSLRASVCIVRYTTRI